MESTGGSQCGLQAGDQNQAELPAGKPGPAQALCSGAAAGTDSPIRLLGLAGLGVLVHSRGSFWFVFPPTDSRGARPTASTAPQACTGLNGPVNGQGGPAAGLCRWQTCRRDLHSGAATATSATCQDVSVVVPRPARHPYFTCSSATKPCRLPCHPCEGRPKRTFWEGPPNADGLGSSPGALFVLLENPEGQGLRSLWHH